MDAIVWRLDVFAFAFALFIAVFSSFVSCRLDVFVCCCLSLSFNSRPETQEVLTVVAGGVIMSGLGIVAALLLNSHRRNNV